MFTDVVGYTALMQGDEEAARIVRRHHRQALDAAVPPHGGDLLQCLADGSLTMFPNVVEAVRAAMEVQHGLRQEPSSRYGSASIRVTSPTQLGADMRPAAPSVYDS